MDQENGAVRDVKQTIERWLQAVRRSDVDTIMAHYADDVLAFDAIGPLQFKGRTTYAEHWRRCMDMCTGDMHFDIHELNITVQGDLALCHSLIRCGGTTEAGEAKTSWMRMTSAYRQRQRGKGDEGERSDWRIVHEHISLPFDVESGKALFDLEP